MQRIVSITRRASTSVLRGSGARRPRQFGSTTPTAFADHDIKAKAGAGSDRQPDVPFQVKKEHEQFADNLKRKKERRGDWFKEKDETERQRPTSGTRDTQRRNKKIYGNPRAGRGAGRGGGGRHSSPRPTDAPRKQKEQPRQSRPRPIATTPWLCVQNIPPSSLLEDIADCIARAMQREIESGIIDLDKAEQFVEGQNETMNDKEGKVDGKDEMTASVEDLPFWDPSEHDSSLNGSYIQEARLLLSVLGRPCGWYLRMPDRCCVQAILSHADEDANRGSGRRLAVSIGGRTLAVGEFDPSKREVLSGDFATDVPLIERSFDRAVRLRLDDSVLRVENCGVQSRPEDLRYLFRRYDIIDTRRLRDDDALDAVQLLVQGNYGRRKGGEKFYPRRDFHGDNKSGDVHPLRTETPVSSSTFIIRFETAADARAAIRDMQMVEFDGRQLRLAQYPKQMLDYE